MPMPKVEEVRVGSYDHLNETDPLSLPLDFDELAERIVKMNYGSHRFLSAFVRARRKSAKHRAVPRGDELANEIENLLNKGLY